MSRGVPSFDRQEFDDWSFPSRSVLPLTPSDSASSDCASTDFRDMPSSRWSPAYMPEDYDAGDVLDDGPFARTDLDAFMIFNAPQGQIDTVPAWTSHTHGFVGTDMTSSLSYMSQSPRSLHTIPDGQPTWNSPAHTHTSAPMVRNASGMSTGISVPSGPPGSLPGHVFVPGTQTLHTGYAQMSAAGHNASHVFKSGQPQGRQPVRSTTGQASSHPNVQQTMIHAGPVPYRPSMMTYSNGSRPVNTPPGMSPYPLVGPHSFAPSYRGGSMLAGPPLRGPILDPIAEDFSNLIDFPPEDPYPAVTSSTPILGSLRPTSYSGSWLVPASPGTPTNITNNHIHPMLVSLDTPQSRPLSRQPSVLAAHGRDAEEGRYRTDPLYNRRVEADGLYHCPFLRSENCGHAPTKLKCNYEYDFATNPDCKAFQAEADHDLSHLANSLTPT